MEDLIKKQQEGKDIATITELNLENCKSTNVVGLSEEWKSLEFLNIINSGLTTLKSFPRLVSLKKLELCDNKLSEGFDALACLPKLSELDLSGNEIKDLEALQPLAEISTLTKLNLDGCDVTDVEEYREKVFKLIPSLEFLDGLSKDGKVSEDDDVDDEEESLDEEEEDEDEEEDVPLTAIYNSINEDGEEEEDEDFEAGDEEDDDDFDEEEGDEEPGAANLSVENVDGKTRGKKRKAEQGEESASKK